MNPNVAASSQSSQGQQQGQQAAQQTMGSFWQGWSQWVGGQGQQQARQSAQRNAQQNAQQQAQAAQQVQQQAGGGGTPPPGGPQLAQQPAPPDPGKTGARAGGRASKLDLGLSDEDLDRLGDLGLNQKGQTQYGGTDYSNAIASIRTGVSEQLSLTPVRALSVSIGQIFQQALGGRAQIQGRAAQANLAAATATKEANFLQSIRDEQAQIEYTLQTRAGDQEFENSDRADGKAALEKRQEQLRKAEEAQEPVVRKKVAEAAEAEEAVSTRTQRLKSQALGVGGIVTGTVLFSKAMEIVSGGMAALADVADKATDELSGFTRTANMASDQLAQVMAGGTGGSAEFAGAQARIGFAGETDALERRARLQAGATNFQAIRDQLRAERNFNGRDQGQGVWSGFNNGPLAGTPLIGEALGWIGQQQSITEMLQGPGDRQGPFGRNATALTEEGETTSSRRKFLRGGGRDAQLWLDRATQGFGGAALRDTFNTRGMLEEDGNQTRFAEGVTLQDFVAGFNAVPGQNSAIDEAEARQMLGLPDDFGTQKTPSSKPLDITTVTTQTEEQLAQIEEVRGLWGEVNDNQKKVNKQLGTFKVTLDDSSKIAKQTAQTFDDQGLHSLAQMVRDFGIEFVDASGDFSDNVERAMDNAALGGTFQDPEKLFQAMMPQLDARVRSMERQAEFQTNTVIPAQFAQSYIQQPSTSTTGMQGIAAAGLFGAAAPTGLGGWGEEIEKLNAQVESFVQEGLTAMNEELGIPKSKTDEIQGYGNEIRRLNELSESLTLGLDQDRYTESLFLQRRALGDIVGLVGQSSASYKTIADVSEDGSISYQQQVVQATKLGVLQKAQISDQRELARLSRLQQLDQRELARISLARSQRELNLQLALSRLQAPGETPQERAVRRREAELVAREKQRELDINKRTTQRGFGIEDIQYGSQMRGFTIEDIGFRRQLRDALKQQQLSESERQISLEVRGIGKLKNATEVMMSTKTGFLELGIGLATQIEEAAISTQETIEAQSGQFLEGFATEVRKVFKPIRTQIRETMGMVTGDGGSTVDTGNQGTPSKGGKNKHGPTAAGGIFDAKGATSFIAGEAGSEQVVVLRNPKMGMSSSGGGVAGGGNTVNISIAINNPSVRKDGDIDTLVEKVKRAIHDEAEVVGVG
jgi:hypothetical protein